MTPGTGRVRRRMGRAGRCGAVVVGVLAALPAAPAQAAPTWTVVPSPNLSTARNELSGADGATASEVWAVGTEIEQPAVGPVTTWRSLLLRWNGAAWSIADHPRPSGNTALHDVDATAAGSAWAVGVTSRGASSATLIERWDGTRWRLVASPNPDPGGSNTLQSVDQQAPNSAWAVGSYSNPTRTKALALTARWDGSQWRAVPNPATTQYQNVLQAVDGSAPNDVWAVGYTLSTYIATPTALLMHWDGQRWRTVSVPSPQHTTLHGVLAVSRTDVWAVGQSLTPGAGGWNAAILHWDGSRWTRVPVPVPNAGVLYSDLRDVVALSAGRVYAVGSATTNTGAYVTLVLRWNGTAWTVNPTPSPPNQPVLRGAAAIGPSTVWAVGHRWDPTVGSSRTLTIRTTAG